MVLPRCPAGSRASTKVSKSRLARASCCACGSDQLLSVEVFRIDAPVCAITCGDCGEKWWSHGSDAVPFHSLLSEIRQAWATRHEPIMLKASTRIRRAEQAERATAALVAIRTKMQEWRQSLGLPAQAQPPTARVASLRGGR